MTTSKLMLNQARRKNDGTYPLVIQLLHQRKKKVIYLNIHLHPEEFDFESGRVVPNKVYYRFPHEIKRLNHTICEFVDTVHQAIRLCEEAGEGYTLEDVYLHLWKNGEGGSLCDYWERVIRRFEQQRRIGTARAQRSTLNSVKQCCKASDLFFGKINRPLILAYQVALLNSGRKRSPNTVAFYMRNFKSLINLAVKEGMLPASPSPLFKGIECSPRKTVKRALSRECLKELATVDLSLEPELDFARDLFMFSFYTRGMAFVDIAFLRHDNLREGAIRYCRRKTSQLLMININQPIRAFIEKYRNVSQYIFPILSPGTDAAQYRKYKNVLRHINKNLKIIQERLGISIPLTTYVARHSWATQAKEKGFSISIISEGLGHTSERITQIYLKELDPSVLDKANDLISCL